MGVLVGTELEKFEDVGDSDTVVSIVDVVTLAGVMVALEELDSVKVLYCLDVNVRVISGASPTVVRVSKEPNFCQTCHSNQSGKRIYQGERTNYRCSNNLFPPSRC